MTAREAVAEGSGALEAGRPGSPFLDATLLLSHAMEIPRDALLARLGESVDADALSRYRSFIVRRVAGEPVAYIVGWREFFGLRFRSDARALMPRPETEGLVETVLSLLPPPRAAGENPIRYHDAFAGSGCVGISVAAQRPDLELSMSDASEDALSLCAENAAAILSRAGAKPTITKGDVLSGARGRFDAISANPPYVDSFLTGEIAAAGTHEPLSALDGGAAGLDFYGPIATQAFGLLADGGFLAVEVGDDQGQAVAAILSGAGFADVAIEPDLAGHDRVVSGVKRDKS